MNQMRDTSLDAYNDLKPKLNEQQMRVYEVLKHGPRSNEQIARELQLPINRITPRTNELVKRGLVMDAGLVFSETTGKKVHAWKLKYAPPPPKPSDPQQLFPNQSKVATRITDYR